MSECIHLNYTSQRALRTQKDLAYEKLQVYLLLTAKRVQEQIFRLVTATMTYIEFLNSGITNYDSISMVSITSITCTGNQDGKMDRQLQTYYLQWPHKTLLSSWVTQPPSTQPSLSPWHRWVPTPGTCFTLCQGPRHTVVTQPGQRAPPCWDWTPSLLSNMWALLPSVFL